MENIIVRIATKEDAQFAQIISDEILASAIIRGSGISKRSPESISKKMNDGKVVIAVTDNNLWVGYSYIEVWANGEFVSNSGLIVSPAYRGNGVANLIKNKIFELSATLYPGSKIFSITTGLAIIKMNARLGFETVTYNEITPEKEFWQGCKSCVNYPNLESNQYKTCKCTAMLYTPAVVAK